MQMKPSSLTLLFCLFGCAQCVFFQSREIQIVKPAEEKAPAEKKAPEETANKDEKNAEATTPAEEKEAEPAEATEEEKKAVAEVEKEDEKADAKEDKEIEQEEKDEAEGKETKGDVEVPVPTAEEKKAIADAEKEDEKADAKEDKEIEQEEKDEAEGTETKDDSDVPEPTEEEKKAIAEAEKESEKADAEEDKEVEEEEKDQAEGKETKDDLSGPEPTEEEKEAVAEAEKEDEKADADEDKEVEAEEKEEKGVPDVDNFKDELIDQADPEFKMYSGGDDCISKEDAFAVAEKSFQLGAPDLTHETSAQKKERLAGQDMIHKEAQEMFDKLDTNYDGCVDKKEFKAGGETEESLKKTKKHNVKKADFNFDVMDRNGDQQISVNEAFHYASESMPHADLSAAKLQKMFNDADTDNDRFISRKEFEEAGKHIKGDGKNRLFERKPNDIKYDDKEFGKAWGGEWKHGEYPSYEKTYSKDTFPGRAAVVAAKDVQSDGKPGDAGLSGPNVGAHLKHSADGSIQR